MQHALQLLTAVIASPSDPNRREQTQVTESAAQIAVRTATLSVGHGV